MHNNPLGDLESLFTLRYVFDEPSDIVDLEQDIQDLGSFPERLNGSYSSEWRTYVKRQLKLQSIELDKLDTLHLLKNLTPESLAQYKQLLKIIHQAQAVTQSDKVKVIKSPLKTYIEALLKI